MVLPGRRADPHEPRGRRCLAAGPGHGHRGARRPARCWASIPRGPGPPTSASTRATPGRPACPSRCGVPIIPVGIAGTRAVQPPGSNLMRPFHSVTIRFGPPLAYEYDGRTVTTGACADPDDEAGADPRPRPGRAAGPDRLPDGGDRPSVRSGVRGPLRHAGRKPVDRSPGSVGRMAAISPPDVVISPETVRTQ